MRSYIKYITFLSLSIGLFSCTEELLEPAENTSDQVAIDVSIALELITRVSDDGSAFTDADIITVQNMNRSDRNIASYTYSSGNWTTQDELYWEGNSNNTFHAWYPSTASYDSFTIPVNQSTDIYAADWMTASSTAKRSEGVVNLSFAHNLTKVTVNVTGWSDEFTESERRLTNAQLLSPSSVVTNGQNGRTGNGITSWIRSELTANDSFVAIIAPGTYASETEIMKLYVNGNSTPLIVKTKSDLTVETGKSYTFNVFVGKDIILLDPSSVSVGPWAEEDLADQTTDVVMQQKLSQLDEYKYLIYNHTYTHNRDYVLSGDSYWELRPFFESPISSISEIELKFQMASTDNAYLFYSERPFKNNGAMWTSSGLKLRWNNSGEDVINNETILTWSQMGVSQTDCIVLKISVTDHTVTVNGNVISVPELGTFTGIEYLFSSYYYMDDDGYAKVYRSVPTNSKLYYIKIGSVYQGYAAQAKYKDGSTQYAWESVINGEVSHEFVSTNYEPLWVYQYTSRWEHFTGGTDYVNLSEEETANSYIVSDAGVYRFTTTKGNSNQSVGLIASAEVLWETLGTDTAPSAGTLIKNVKYDNNAITFETPATFKKGNAVIAAKNASGKILWSWHIWLTDEPSKQVYYNNAGSMMDRNLGATTATPGSATSHGLMYQWGRKDPFPGMASYTSSSKAETSIKWPSAVTSTESIGTIAYTIENPTTFIKIPVEQVSNGTSGTSTVYPTEGDWLYAERDDNLWASTKTIYDPCPAGWRVPDGGRYGAWSVAFGSPENISDYPYDSQNHGINFSGSLGSSSTIWYPSAGYISSTSGNLVDSYGMTYYASVTPAGFQNKVRLFDLNQNGWVVPAFDAINKAEGTYVRCFREYSEGDNDVVEDEEEEVETTASYSLNLTPSSYGWIKSSSVSNPDASLYDGVYESTNQGINSSYSLMYIDIKGYSNFKFYVRSYAENNYDYVMVSQLDKTITSSSTGDTYVKKTTKGNQNSSTSINGYTLVEFNNIDGGSHRISVIFTKDSSQSTNDDKGYVLIPKNQ